MVIDALLASYPRARPPLSPAHRRIYVEEYRLNRLGGGRVHRAARRLASWNHRMIARRGGPGTVLELGAGSLEHSAYEAGATAYDVVEPFRELYQESPHRRRPRRIYSDLDDVPAQARYDRIVSKAVLEHLTDLPGVVAQCGPHLEPQGVFQAGIPSEGSFLWGLAWRATTGVSYKMRTGLDYGTVMRHEHVSTALEILAVVRHFFAEVRVRRFPLPLFHLSLYTYLEARRPDLTRCREYQERAG